MNSYQEFLQYSKQYYSNFHSQQGKPVEHCCQDNHAHKPEHHQEQNSNYSEEQRHVHEFEGSTKLAEENDERHNHRFAGVTGQAILLTGGSHFHEIFSNTDFFDHFHQIQVRTGPAIEVGNGKHVHFVTGTTTFEDDHVHQFQFATLIESPLLPLR